MPAITNAITPQSGGLYSKNSVVQFDRPNNATAYGAGDVVADQDSVDTAANAIQFKGVGRSGRVTGAHIVMEEADTANLELWLFDQEPTGQVDNAALALVAADNSKVIGVLAFADSAKFSGGAATKVYVPTLPTDIRYAASDGTLWGLLVTRSAYTPIASQQFDVSIQVEADHH